jgi:hypothetical protein
MYERELAAIKGSVEKWEGIVNLRGIDHGEEDCPLCIEFREESSCDGCPIKIKTGTSLCFETPYEEWRNTSDRLKTEKLHIVGFNSQVMGPKSLQAAQKELQFLKDLYIEWLEKAHVESAPKQEEKKPEWRAWEDITLSVTVESGTDDLLRLRDGGDVPYIIAIMQVRKMVGCTGNNEYKLESGRVWRRVKN